ncbi:MAG TPA: redoxin domain-containing protein [Gemmata sp.]|jgi:peroxiredoxin|nr:redoxin domain-containing protein [Gemmata sp.]
MIASFAILIGVIGINADPPADTSQVITDFGLSDAAGKKHSLKEWEGSKAVVFFFIWSECPASNGYAPELARLFKDFTDKGVKFYGVHSDPDLTAEQALAHSKEYQLPFPVLLDPTQSLARQTGAKRNPTAVILSPEGNVLYRGRIDDRYISLGKKRAEPTKRDTQDALTLIVSGKTPAFAETEVIGCLIPKVTAPKDQKPK